MYTMPDRAGLGEMPNCKLIRPLQPQKVKHWRCDKTVSKDRNQCPLTSENTWHHRTQHVVEGEKWSSHVSEQFKQLSLLDTPVDNWRILQRNSNPGPLRCRCNDVLTELEEINVNVFKVRVINEMEMWSWHLFGQFKQFSLTDIFFYIPQFKYIHLFHLPSPFFFLSCSHLLLIRRLLWACNIRNNTCKCKHEINVQAENQAMSRVVGINNRTTFGQRLSRR